MNDVVQVVHRAARRIALNRTTRAAARGLIGVSAVAVLAVLADNLVYLGAGVIYLVATAGLVAVAAVVPVIVRGWPRPAATAVEVDRRLRLRERLSTAMAVVGSDSPMARAVMDDARAYARSVPVSDTFPIKAHREYLIVACLIAVTLGLQFYMPQFDLLARHKKLILAQKEREEVQREAKKLKRELVKIRRKLEGAGLERADFHVGKMEEVVRKMEAGELKRAEAMAKLDELAKKLQEEQQGMPKKGGLLPRSLAKRPGLDKTRKLADALAKKDLDAVKAELDKLGDEAALENLDADQLKQLAREMQKLADELEKADAKDLAKSLKKASQAMQQCANCKKPGDKALDPNAMAALNKALKQCQFQVDKQADLQKELDALAEAQKLCEGCKQGLGKRTLVSGNPYKPEPDRSKIGKGMGENGGIGKGGEWAIDEHKVKFDPTGLKGQLQSGRVVGSFFIDGKHVKSDAKVEYKEAVQAAASEATEALDQDQIPRAYERIVRDYFQGMKSE